MKRQIKKGEDCFVNCDGVDVHGSHSDTFWFRAQKRSRPAKISSADLVQVNGRGLAL